MSIEKFPKEEIPSEERLPDWVDRIKGIYEKVKSNKKVLRKLTKYAREDLEIIEETRTKGKITELQYWEDIRDWLQNNAILDSWWGNINIEE